MLLTTPDQARTGHTSSLLIVRLFVIHAYFYSLLLSLEVTKIHAADDSYSCDDECGIIFMNTRLFNLNNLMFLIYIYIYIYSLCCVFEYIHKRIENSKSDINSYPMGFSIGFLYPSLYIYKA